MKYFDNESAFGKFTGKRIMASFCLTVTVNSGRFLAPLYFSFSVASLVFPLCPRKVCHTFQFTRSISIFFSSAVHTRH